MYPYPVVLRPDWIVWAQHHQEVFVGAVLTLLLVFIIAWVVDDIKRYKARRVNKEVERRLRDWASRKER